MCPVLESQDGAINAIISLEEALKGVPEDTTGAPVPSAPRTTPDPPPPVAPPSRDQPFVSPSGAGFAAVAADVPSASESKSGPQPTAAVATPFAEGARSRAVSDASATSSNDLEASASMILPPWAPLLAVIFTVVTPGPTGDRLVQGCVAMDTHGCAHFMCDDVVLPFGTVGAGSEDLEEVANQVYCHPFGQPWPLLPPGIAMPDSVAALVRPRHGVFVYINEASFNGHNDRLVNTREAVNSINAMLRCVRRAAAVQYRVS